MRILIIITLVEIIAFCLNLLYGKILFFSFKMDKEERIRCNKRKSYYITKGISSTVIINNKLKKIR